MNGLSTYAKNKRMLMPALFIFLILVTGIGYAWRSSALASTRKTLQTATTHRPENLTELYFTSPQTIPRTYISGEALPVSFTIHNLEGVGMKYGYQIAVNGVVSVSGTVSAHDGETRTTQSSIQFPGSDQRVEVEVKLINNNQAVHFWLERKLET